MPDVPDQSRTRRELLDNHQRCWIWGKNTVLETLHAGRWKIWELHYDECLPNDVIGDLKAHAQARRTPLVASEATTLEKLCKSSEHQGLIAKMSPFPYATLDELLLRLADPQASCSILLLDRIQDPFNFGGIIRSAAGLGATAIIIGQQHQTGVNSLVARSSSGIVNHIPIVNTSDLSQTLLRLKELRLTVYATSGSTHAQSLTSISFAPRHVVMIGSEAWGLASNLLDLSDVTLKIPLAENVESLNAAVAAGIIGYEIYRQRPTALSVPTTESPP